MNNNYNLPAPKIYVVDYSFIIKNYLDPSLWDKIWSIFEYRNFIITMNLHVIFCYDKSISLSFFLKDNSNDDGWENTVDNSICIYLNNINLVVIQKKINSIIYSLIESMERKYIENLDDYKQISEIESREEIFLKAVAEDYLDENDVTNKNIREAYIDAYVGDNSKGAEYRRNFVEKEKYKHLTDLYLVFAQSIGDKEKIKLMESYMADYSENDNLEKAKELESEMESENRESFASLLEAI